MEHRDDRSLSTTTPVTNILAGTPFEFVQRRPAAVLVYACTDPPAAGDEGEYFMSVLFGTVIVAQDIPIPAFTPAGMGPTRADHLLVSGVAAPGDRIVVSLRTTGAALRVRTLISIRPV
jgi:hypothetical protein